MKKKHKKQSLETMKENGMKALNNQATLDTWDGHSPIWAYCYTTDETRKITNVKKIRQLLVRPQPCVYFFLTWGEMENYRTLLNYIDNEVNNMINKNILHDFPSN